MPPRPSSRTISKSPRRWGHGSLIAEEPLPEQPLAARGDEKGVPGQADYEKRDEDSLRRVPGRQVRSKWRHGQQCADTRAREGEQPEAGQGENAYGRHDAGQAKGHNVGRWARAEEGGSERGRE